MTEAVGLADEGAAFVDETGIAFSHIIILYEGVDFDVPDAEVAADYHEALGSPGIPVLSDVNQGALDLTPYDGTAMPGWCVTTPEMEILYCDTGHGVNKALGSVQEHAEGG